MASAGFGQHQEAVFGHLRGDRRAHGFPVWQQLVECTRIKHRAGEGVRANFSGFLDQADGDFLAALGGQLLEPDGC